MHVLLLSALLACTPKTDDTTDDSATPEDTATDDTATDDTGGDDTATDDTATDDTAADDTATDDTATDDTATDDTGTEPAPLEDIRAAVQAWFEADHSAGPRTLLSGLPDGEEIDARTGQPARETLPAQVLAAFDFAVRLEAAGEGSVRLDRGVLETYEIYIVTTTTDADDAYVEVWTPDERLVTGARFYADEVPLWDAFDGRVRLARRFTMLEGPSWEDGYSEAEERAAAGQPAQDWPGDIQVLSGFIPQAGSLMGTVDFDGLALSDVQRDVAVAAFDFIWEPHLQHTVNGGRVTLGPQDQGVMVVGSFTRSTDGETYMVADWRDIDDGSYVLYFVVGSGDPMLSVVQYDN
ncbi:MAG: hypothetical protein H6739_39900 [Alphaproteobacteria bacterium]|nr:hypothetical protein [Alphaproteobacteria bacterium]